MLTQSSGQLCSEFKFSCPCEPFSILGGFSYTEIFNDCSMAVVDVIKLSSDDARVIISEAVHVRLLGF